MEEHQESRQLVSIVDQKVSLADGIAISTAPDEKDDDEDEEEEEEDKIVEKSYNNRFHKRNKRLPTQIGGVDNTFIAIEPKSGKEVIWNEIILPEKKTERDNKFLNIAKKLKRQAHPFLIRFLDAWITKNDNGTRKLVFVNERLDDGTLKQFLCNSTSRSKLLWRRHIGQLLSVLIYLQRLGVTHGHLKKEAIYYQSSGNIKVGPFMLDLIFGQKSADSDIYAFGVLALEIAVWTQAIDAQATSEEEKFKLMLANLTDPQQRNFIEACCDPNPSNRPKIKTLVNHPAVAEVPTLKLLSAKVIVTFMKSLPPDDVAGGLSGVGPGGVAETVVGASGAGVVTGVSGVKAETSADFAELLRDHISHLEDETVILDVSFPADQVFKTRTWKDYRSNFTLTSKFLEDVKSGFYLFLGYRFGAVAAELEEDEEGSAGPIGSVAATTADWTVGRAQPLMATSSSGVISDVASSTTSRKHSACATSVTESPPCHLPTACEIPSEGTKLNGFSDFSLTASAASVTSASAAPLVVSMRLDSAPGDTKIRHRSLPNSSDAIIFASQLEEFEQNKLNGAGMRATAEPELKATMEKDSTIHTAGAGIATTVFADVPNNGVQQPCAFFQPTATSNREKRMRQKSAFACGTNDVGTFGSSPQYTMSTATRPSVQSASDYLDSKDSLNHAHNLPHTPHASIASTLTQSAGLSLASAIGVAAPRASANVASAGIADVNEAELEEINAEVSDDDDEDDDDDDDEDDQNDSDEEEAEEGGNKAGVRGTERGTDGTPQVVHVPPPNQPPTTSALFTHCQYAYIGAGRWQVYVQMWFVEERLKREAYVQVLENEWHDYDRIADLFEGSKCLSSGDKSILIRLLALARHNIPLVEGTLVYPCFGPQWDGSVYTRELYSKLITLHLHQQSQELIAQASSSDDATEAVPAVGANSISSQQQMPAALQPAKSADLNDNATAISTLAAKPVDGTMAPAAAPVVLPSGVTTTASDPCLSSRSPSQGDPGPCPHESVERTGLNASVCVNGDSQTIAVPPPAQSTAIGATGAGGIPVNTSNVPVQITDQNPLQPTSKVVATQLNDNQGFVEMVDVGTLAPHNSSCAFCDYHDYLHRTDLPNYLTCPCYHCRESLARDAKVTPEDLFDLHLQHNVPWPAFLQSRFNIPPDSRSLEDLIAYDCRWRGREPCICLPDSGPLPPCVELPWFYSGPLTAAATSATPQLSPKPVSLSTDISSLISPIATTVTDAKTSDGLSTSTASPQVAVLPPKPLSVDNTASSKHHHPLTTVLPCASRHSRGFLGPPQCCNPVGRSKDIPHPEATEHQCTPLPPGPG